MKAEKNYDAQGISQENAAGVRRISPRQNETEEIIVDITSSEIEKELREMNIYKKVRGGLILRSIRITMPLRKHELQVGDRVIFMGVRKELANDLKKLRSNTS